MRSRDPLERSKIVWVSPNEDRHGDLNGAVAVVGPGTGFGAALCVPTSEGKFTVTPSEFGMAVLKSILFFFSLHFFNYDFAFIDDGNNKNTQYQTANARIGPWPTKNS